MPPPTTSMTAASTPAKKNWPHRAMNRSPTDCLTDRFHERVEDCGDQRQDGCGQHRWSSVERRRRRSLAHRYARRDGPTDRDVRQWVRWTHRGPRRHRPAARREPRLHRRHRPLSVRAAPAGRGPPVRPRVGLEPGQATRREGRRRRLQHGVGRSARRAAAGVAGSGRRRRRARRPRPGERQSVGSCRCDRHRRCDRFGRLRASGRLDRCRPSI